MLHVQFVFCINVRVALTLGWMSQWIGYIHADNAHRLLHLEILLLILFVNTLNIWEGIKKGNTLRW